MISSTYVSANYLTCNFAKIYWSVTKRLVQFKYKYRLRHVTSLICSDCNALTNNLFKMFLFFLFSVGCAPRISRSLSTGNGNVVQ